MMRYEVLNPQKGECRIIASNILTFAGMAQAVCKLDCCVEDWRTSVRFALESIVFHFINLSRQIFKYTHPSIQ
jgi:hypothetical protein